jgi:hypothetical protein
VNNYQYGIHLSGECTPAFGADSSEWNDIYSNGPGDPGRDLRNGTQDIDAQYVYWGTVVEAEIEERIYHKPDDPSLGVVNYDPWTNAAHDDVYSGIFVEREGGIVPEAFDLGQNHPNPVRSVTEIRYALPGDCWVRLEIFDVSGRKIMTLLDGSQKAGFKAFRWDTSQMAAGVYFYRLEAGGFVQTRKMVLAR